MTIAFIHNNRAFLPEIEAYISFFSAYPGIKTEVRKQSGLQGAPADVEWYFMGTHLKRGKNIVVIHEYASASIPPFAALSKDYTQTALRLSGYKNIYFKGPVPYHQVYAYIHQCRYAINFMPDISPFNKQVSAKFLDYAACKIPVVTSDYEWIKEFEAVYGGRYFYLLPDLSNFTWEQVNAFSYAMPDLREWTWKKQIEKSGVTAFLQKRFPGLVFSENANKSD